MSMRATCSRTSTSGWDVLVVVAVGVVVVVLVGVGAGVSSTGAAQPASMPAARINPTNLFIDFLVCRTHPILANGMVTIVDMNNAQTMLIAYDGSDRSEEHTSELQSRFDLVCRLL